MLHEVQRNDAGMFTPGIWNDAMLLALSRDTGWWLQPLANDYHDIRAHIPILYAIARNICWPDQRHGEPVCDGKPPLCLEIGVRLGISTIAILYAMKETGGRLISLEFDDGTKGDRENYAAKAQERINAAGLSKWWQLEVQDSNEFDVTNIPGPLDFLWIDGAHDAGQVRKDMLKYSPLVRKNGMMVLHDYFSTVGPCDPPTNGPWISEVSIPVEEFRATSEWEICTLPYSFGLTLMRKLV